MLKKITISLFLFLSLLHCNLLVAKELKEVTLQPSWFEQFQFAGYYMAKEKGFYQDAGLAVKINPFEIKNKSEIVQKITNGEVDFAIGRETLILENVDNKKIIFLYALFQSSPLVLLTTKASKIDTFAQFTDKKIMATIGDAQQVSLKAMLNSNHVQLSDLDFLPHTHNINDLVNQKTDIISAYISKTPHDLEKMGVAYNVFSPVDYGFDLYSDFLYTSHGLIARDAETVKAFRQASLKGWQYAFTHIIETVDLILEKYNQQNLTKEALVFEALALKKLAYLNTKKLGEINESKLKKSVDLYKVLGVEQGKVDFSHVIYNEKHPLVFFTEQENQYLKQKKKIMMCIAPNWLPYEAFDQDGEHIGLNTEFINIFRKQLPIPLEIVRTDSWSESVLFAKQRKCDLLSLAAKTQERRSFLNFTSPYLVFPSILVTRPNVPFIDDFNLLSAKKIGIPKGYAQRKIIKKNYPDIKIVEVETLEDGLEKVASGEIYGIIGIFDSVSYLLQHQFVGQLKVSGKFDHKRELGIGVRNDDKLLLDIFEKLVTSLTEETKNNIISKSTTIKYVAKFNYNILWWILLLGILIISAFLYRQRMLNNLNKILNDKVSEKTKALQLLNESLEIKIKERTKKIERSKEILQNVAYQDSLTGIFNRHYLFDKSVSLFKQSVEFEEPLFLLIIDIDDFKKVNDTYGHIIGDNILKYFVNNIQKILRTGDLFARYGGEEFVVLLPNINIDDCLIIAEKLRTYTAQHPYVSAEKGQTIAFTISIGISLLQQADSLEKLIDRADSALYGAKETGKNQVHIASCAQVLNNAG